MEKRKNIPLKIRILKFEKKEEKKFSEKLIKENWRLQKKWKEKIEKSEIQEQIIIQIGNTALEIYNFGNLLEKRHIQELEQVVKMFAHIQDGRVFQKVKYILIDNTQHRNIKTDEELNGYSNAENDNSIRLYPAGMQFSSHRIKTASNFEGTLIHEFSHSLANDFKNEWFREKKFNWAFDKFGKEYLGGITQYYNKQPDKCVSDYACLSPKEDFCESMVAALKMDKTLDPERLKFIKEKVLNSSVDKLLNDISVKTEVSIERKLGNEVKFPEII